MLMRGDLQQIFDKINPSLEVLEKRLMALEKELEGLKEPKRPVGRPKKEKSENKVA